MKKFKILLAVLIAFVWLLISAIPCFALTPDPDVIQINSVWVYESTAEDHDQIYLIDYTLNYTVSPTETVTEAFLFRLMNGGTELQACAPYNMVTNGDDGWGRGLVAMYFTAAEAPTWAGAYTAIVTGNPLLTWTADPLTDSTSAFNWRTYPFPGSQNMIASKLLTIAGSLESAWGGTLDLIQVSDAKTILTSDGENYFLNVIPNLRDVAPGMFSGETITPESDIKQAGDFSYDYATSLENDILTAGNPLNFTTLAASFGITSLTRGVITAVLYYAIVIFLLILACRAMNTYKPLMMFMIPFVILGAFVGVPLTVTIIVAFFCLVTIGYILFYRGASA